MAEHDSAPVPPVEVDALASIDRLSGPKRALLEARRAGASNGNGAETRRPGALPPETIELSFAQERVWLLEQLAPGLVTYNAPRALRLEGVLDVEALQCALDEIVRRHQVLRTVVGESDGLPMPRVLPEARVPMRMVDLGAGDSRNGHGDPEEQLVRLVEHEVNQPFDLTSDTMLRCLLIRLAPDDHVLVIVSHHIASDDRSKRIVAAELDVLYRAFRDGTRSPLPPLPMQYASYAAWERRRVEAGVADEDAAYWCRQLDGAPSSIELPSDRPRPSTDSHGGAMYRSSLPGATTDRLRQLVRAHRSTLFMGLHAGFVALLRRLSGATDIVVGTPVSGRSRSEFDDMIGFFSNTLVLRSDVPGRAGFATLLDDVRSVCVDAFSHQLLPFERLVELVKPERDISRHPIFQVMFTLRPGGVSVPELADLVVSPVQFRSSGTKFDLSLIAIDMGDHVQLNWEYSTDLFDEATVARMAAQFGRLMDQALADPDRPIDELDLLD
ncbi:MAG: condensation domain-containing protein, partial [Acidimicrobiales bacterium]